MQKTVPMLQSQMRNDRGSRKARKLRDSGQIPVVVYGHGEAPVSIAVNLHQLSEALHHGNRIFEADLNGTKQTLLVKDLQYDYLGRKVIHADMVRVDLTETVQVTVPVETRGTAKSGIIDILLGSLQVECVVTSIPDKFSISVREMNIGDMVKAEQIPLPAGVKLVTDPGALVLMCHEVAEIKTTEELEQEMPAGPEVITERVREEGEEGATEGGKEKKRARRKRRSNPGHSAASIPLRTARLGSRDSFKKGFGWRGPTRTKSTRACRGGSWRGWAIRDRIMPVRGIMWDSKRWIGWPNNWASKFGERNSADWSAKGSLTSVRWYCSNRRST